MSGLKQGRDIILYNHRVSILGPIYVIHNNKHSAYFKKNLYNNLILNFKRTSSVL